MLSIIEESCSTISSEDAAIAAAGRNSDVARYLDNNYKLKDSRKLRWACRMLAKHTSIRIVTKKPLVFEWIGDRPSPDPSQPTNQ